MIVNRSRAIAARLDSGPLWEGPGPSSRWNRWRLAGQCVTCSSPRERHSVSQSRLPFQIYSFLFFCDDCFCLRVCLGTTCMQCPWRSQESVGSPEAGVTGVCELLRTELGLPVRAADALTTEPSFQPQQGRLLFLCCAACASP